MNVAPDFVAVNVNVALVLDDVASGPLSIVVSTEGAALAGSATTPGTTNAPTNSAKTRAAMASNPPASQLPSALVAESVGGNGPRTREEYAVRGRPTPLRPDRAAGRCALGTVYRAFGRGMGSVKSGVTTRNSLRDLTAR